MMIGSVPPSVALEVVEVSKLVEKHFAKHSEADAVIRVFITVIAALPGTNVRISL